MGSLSYNRLEEKQALRINKKGAVLQRLLILVRTRRLELPRPKAVTRSLVLRVCQFRHARKHINILAKLPSFGKGAGNFFQFSPAAAAEILLDVDLPLAPVVLPALPAAVVPAASFVLF